MNYFNHPNLPLYGYSYDGDKAALAQVERDTARGLREALDDLLLAKKVLADTRESLSDYSGQWREGDRTRDEEQTLVAASHAFEDALVASMKARLAARE